MTTTNADLLRSAAAAIDVLAKQCNAEESHAWLCKLLEAAAGESEPRGALLSSQAIQWLAEGDRGASAETIFTHLTGVDALRGTVASHPDDAVSFGRCRKLLEQCPEIAERFHGMRFVSPYWNALFTHWQLLCEEMDIEAPNWRRNRGVAPSTFSRIKNLINEVRAGDTT